jgi:hypothetical protein
VRYQYSFNGSAHLQFASPGVVGCSSFRRRKIKRHTKVGAEDVDNLLPKLRVVISESIESVKSGHPNNGPCISQEFGCSAVLLGHPALCQVMLGGGSYVLLMLKCQLSSLLPLGRQ